MIELDQIKEANKKLRCEVEITRGLYDKAIESANKYLKEIALLEERLKTKPQIELNKDDLLWLTKVATQYARSKQQFSVLDKANEIRVKNGFEKIFL